MGEYILKLLLWSPQSFKDATQEMRDKICNGAGPAGFGWLVPDNLLGLLITAAADIHDWMYAEAHTEAERLQADLTFLRNMIVLIVQRDIDPDTGWFERRLTLPRLAWACRYFIGVWRAGASFYKKGEKL